MASNNGVTSIMPTLDDIKKAASKELNDEFIKAATKKYKAQLQAVQRAKQLLENEERELAAIEAEMANGIYD